MRVLVTGGAGYIGSVCAEELLLQGHEVTVVDNLSTGHREAVPEGASFHHVDITDWSYIDAILRQASYGAVFHFAAKALVGESVDDPALYYRTNLLSATSFLEGVRKAGVRRFVFSSSCAVYGDHTAGPIYEDHPTHPVNPYGETKLAFENLLKWYSKAYGLNVCCLRYFNAAGATEAHGEDHQPETHLIPLLLEAAAGEREFVINGNDYPTVDGTCVRDYVHVLDIAQAHILALQNLESPGFNVYNIGTGAGFSVYEVLAMVAGVTGQSPRYSVGARRPGDPAVLSASPRKIAAELGWKPQHSTLDNIIETAWKWKTRKK